MQSIQHKSLSERSIGAILIDAGRLSAIDAEKILREQKQNNLRFGDAALKLGLLDQGDIQFALARQFDYPYLSRGDKSISEEVIAAFNPFSPIVEQIRALRTQLMLRWFDADTHQKSLAIVSPGIGDGRSFIAANLAVVFSQLGERTLLIDADLRNPRQHQLFKVGNSTGLSAVLAGRATPDNVVLKVDKLLSLSILPAGATPPNPLELLSRDVFSTMLGEYSESFDVIIIDTPAGSVSADAQTISARAGAALLIASNNKTPVATIQSLAGNLKNSNVAIVGSLLNDI
jgi:chain length determinant protein tyrosine kinase EpsG